MNRIKKGLSIREITVFAMLGALMFVGDIAFEWAMNVHPVTMLLMLYTVVYGKKGIIPFFIYILLEVCFFPGFWIVPYLYIFPIYWLCTLALPKKGSLVMRQACYSIACAMFGLLFGTLYAPFAVLMFSKGTTLFAYILSGLGADAVHAAGNFAMSFLIIPLSSVLAKAEKQR